MDLGFLKELGIDREAGLSYTGNEDKYLSAIGRYCNAYEKNRAKAEETFAAKDYENYTIIVHSLKSNSRMIGATELAAMFETLEMAARNNEINVIEEKTAETLEIYGQLTEQLRPYCPSDEKAEAGELSSDEAKKTAEALLAALDDFDDELSKKLALTLSAYPFAQEEKNKLKEAQNYIEDFMYDEAADLIKGISPTIK